MTIPDPSWDWRLALFAMRLDASGNFTAGSLPWFNVMSYGAVNDGTTDDTTAINSAIAALVSAGSGVLYFPAGTGYKTTAGLSSITVPCLILGDGMAGNQIPGGGASRILCTSQTAYTFSLNSPGIEIRGLSGANTYGGTPSAGAFIRAGNATAADFLQIIAVSTTGFYIGVDIQNGTGWTMDRCLMHGFVQYGIKVRYVAIPDGGDSQISNSHFDAETYRSQAGIHIESGGGLKIINSKTNGNIGAGHGFLNGIELLVASSVATSDLLIANCSIEGWTSNGILGLTSSGTSTWANILITGNEIATQSAAASAIGFVATTAGDFSGLSIVGNVMNQASGSAAAIVLTKCDDVTVGPNNWGVYTNEATFTTCTNVHDRTGGIGAGVQVTGTPTSGQVPIATSGTAATWQTPSGGVTSVGLTVPAEFAVSGSPVTGSGTLAVTKANESANTVWAGPTSGGAAAPTFRALVAADIAGLVSSSGTDHQHIDAVTFSGDGSTTAFELPAAPFDAYSVQAFVAGVRVGQSLSGTMLTTMTFDTAPASGTDNIVVDIVAVAA